MAYSFLFSRIYDTAFYPFLHGIRKRIAFEIVEAKPKSIIDMCCGTGNQIKYLKKIKNTNIIGIDISENMLTVARNNKLEKYCQKQNAANTNFENESFDIAILSFILHETKPEIAEKIIKEAQRIVKKAGKIIIIDYVFDKKTSFIGKTSVCFVECIIGGQHYLNFKTYIKKKLLEQYTCNLQIVSEYEYVFGAVRIHTFNNN